MDVRVAVVDEAVLAGRAAASRDLRRILAEAVILQDAADELLRGLRHRPELSEVARPCLRLRGRFADLREALPTCGDPELDGLAAALRGILDHHVLLLRTSVNLLLGEARSERLSDALDALDGLGEPARRLEAIRAGLLGADALRR